MDQKKFDELVQKLTADASRRGVVKGALSGAVASALGAVGISAADAKKDGKGKNAGKNRKGDGGGDGDGKKGGKGNGGGKGDGDGGDADEERCVANGKRCGRGGGKRRKPCKKCCSRRSVETDRGRKCACRPDGDDCLNDAQCCSGICTGGVCVPNYYY